MRRWEVRDDATDARHGRYFTREGADRLARFLNELNDDWRGDLAAVYGGTVVLASFHVHDRKAGAR